jgi:Fur family transcriptional regulator, ferric uptake regulator
MCNKMAQRYTNSMPRPSPVTDGVRDLLHGGEHRLWTLDELLRGVRARVPSANFSTVLRAVGTLERGGMVDRIDIGDGKAHYERRSPHHEHVVCESCGRVEQIDGCLAASATRRAESKTGFKINDHRLVISGLCPACAAS